MNIKRVGAGLMVTLLLHTGTPAALAAKNASVSQTQAVQADEATVRLQKRLITLGFLTGDADGLYGKKTTNAVKAFQAFCAKLGYDIAQDGVAGARTKELLSDDAILKRRLSPRRGDSGAPTDKLQKRLVELGYLTQSPDGAFGGDTETALIRFQEMLIEMGVKDVDASGVADDLTRDYLYEQDLSGFIMKTPVFFDDSQPLLLNDCYLYAKSAVVIDADTGEILFGKAEDQRVYPASTTKLMTLLVGLTRGKLKQPVTVPDAAAKIPSDSSRVPVTPGEVMPFSDLLYGLMIRSGNDAAMAIAALTGGSVEGFVKAMNKKAAALGMKGTHFTNPHGYHDAEHYTTAFDMALLMRAALCDDKALTVLEARRYTMAATVERKNQPLALANTYEILDAKSDFYYSGMIGGKTGYTSLAGQCFVGAAKRDGITLIAAVMDSGCHKEDKWIDTARLLEYGFQSKGA